MQTELFTGIGRRTDYTFKFNAGLGRHGWLRLTPAYSVKLVRELIQHHGRPGARILDPFAGTGTTGLVAAELGHEATLFDINPFLVWLGNTKCHHFSAEKLRKLQADFSGCLACLSWSEGGWTPPIHNIERWWHPATLAALASIRQALVAHFGEPSGHPYHNLVWVAFARLVIETSSAAFNHVSMSFKDSSPHYGFSETVFLFQAIFDFIVGSAKAQPSGQAAVLRGDARNLAGQGTQLFDLVITSPPYPNRISYIRELRPYMYWTKFLHNGNDAGNLDWLAIGGTWGAATSNLKNWQPANQQLPDQLYEVCEKIKSSGDKNSRLMSNYVHKYFDDMHTHLANLRARLNPQAKLNYIVGNSSFYGHFVQAESILAQILAQLGYQQVSATAIRKRNSKKGLLEFNISAGWDG